MITLVELALFDKMNVNVFEKGNYHSKSIILRMSFEDINNPVMVLQHIYNIS